MLKIKSESLNKFYRFKVLGLFLITTVLLIVFVFWHLKKDGFGELKKDTFQAVFLENNQVYFGKLSNESRTYITLSNVYYLRYANSLQGVESSSQGVNLVKLGGEFHKPENAIYIPKSKVLFWENLTKESPVVSTILSNNR